MAWHVLYLCHFTIRNYFLISFPHCSRQNCNHWPFFFAYCQIFSPVISFYSTYGLYKISFLNSFHPWLLSWHALQFLVSILSQHFWFYLNIQLHSLFCMCRKPVPFSPVIWFLLFISFGYKYSHFENKLSFVAENTRSAVSKWKKPIKLKPRKADFHWLWWYLYIGCEFGINYA